MPFPPYLRWNESRLNELVQGLLPHPFLPTANSSLENKHLGVPLRWDLDFSGFKSSVLGKLKHSIIRNLVLDNVTKRLS
jgi:hypothetical protein